MKKGSWIKRLLSAKFIGLIIGLCIFGLIALLNFSGTSPIFSNLDDRITDLYFYFREAAQPKRISEGAITQSQDSMPLNLSPDIVLVGIDNRALEKFGRWPFPRYVHADFFNRVGRVSDPKARENATFLDVFFIEPEANPSNDFALKSAIKENGKVFTETVLENITSQESIGGDFDERQKILLEKTGKFKSIQGPWQSMPSYSTTLPPLAPIAEAALGSGHANWHEDEDKVFRRQPLVAKYSELLELINFDDLKPDLSDYNSSFRRYVYVNNQGQTVNIEAPLTETVIKNLGEKLKVDGLKKQADTDEDGKIDKEYFVIRKIQDHFVPSITLALALNYFHKKANEIEVVLGSHILIPNPMVLNPQDGNLYPYKILKSPAKQENGVETVPAVYKSFSEIKIPIDDYGQMAVNFLGRRTSESTDGHQTFPYRSYAGYAASAPGTNSQDWPETLALENKILMVGPFSQGMADDEKTTPYGLMYGVELHANALNTILMANFIQPLSPLVRLIILFIAIMLISFITSRLPSWLSLIITFFTILVYFLSNTFIFDYTGVVFPFSTIALGMAMAFILIVVYRALTEEKDKKKIRAMFGKYVSPEVVSQMMDSPPELGGVDKELTVLFSDIRGFTTLSETLSPQELVNHLNIYLTTMTDIILEYKGTLDKYVGDEVMCFWGAPLDQKKHALLAAKCALKQMEALAELNAGWPENKRINIGIGLNSGIMTVGNMGSPGRMNYTLMGDNVNLGARLEGTNKEYGTNVIISEFTYSLIKDTAIVRELDNIRVKGKNKPVLIYELLDFTDGFDLPPEFKK